VPAVVFGPDRVIGRGRPRTALVLGAGGIMLFTTAFNFLQSATAK